MAIYSIGTRSPKIHPSAYISEHAVVIGDVEIAEGVTVWPGAVIRGDNEKITIGIGTNVQDGAVLHADPGFPLSIGEYTSIGHQAMLHGCTVGSRCLIGIQAIVLNGALIEENSLVGAGALVGERKSFPGSSLIVGAPGKVLRTVSDEAAGGIYANALEYMKRGKMYSSELVKVA